MMTYQETLAWMHTMPRTRTAPTLERIRVLLAMLGNPEKKLAGRFIHVTGTNGKGSFCAFTSSALQRAGYKTGRFISPFIMEFRERMEINGVQISEEEVITLGSRIRAAVERMTAETGLTPLEFELVTAMGLLWFAEQDCDLVVLEVGIGGMHDPTNVVVPLLSVIMRVDYDHTELLGDTLTAIAANKAGIIKENAPCVLYADNEPEVIETVRARCKETHSPLILPESAETGVIEAVPGRLVFSYRGEQYTLHLSGLYQLQNALCAIEVLRALPILGYPVSGEDIRLGLGDATFPARFEVLKEQDTVILDGAHNGSGMHAMRENIECYFGDTPILCLCGMLRDKAPEDALAEILSMKNITYTACITPPTPRAMEGKVLAGYFRDRGIPAEGYASIPEALDALLRMQYTTHAPILCFGSLYSAGDIRRYFGKNAE